MFYLTDLGGGSNNSSSSSLSTGGGSGGNVLRPSPGSNQGSLDRRSPAPNGPPPVAPKTTTPHSHHSHVTQHHGNTSKYEWWDGTSKSYMLDTKILFKTCLAIGKSICK